MNFISPTLNCKNLILEIKKKGLPVYNFGLGENPLPTHFYYRKLVQNCANYKGYTSPSGINELQNCIKKRYSSETYKVQNILLGNGLKELLFLVQFAFTGKIFHITPSWVSYKEQIKILNKEKDLILINTKFENKYRIDLNELESELKKYESEPKLLILNNPNNPTGLIYPEKEIKKLAKLLDKYNTIVFADEIYFNIAHFNDIVSISKYIPHLTIKGSSVSKDLACGGYRLGWITFPKELKELFLKCKSYASSIYSSANTPIQYATYMMFKNENYINDYFKNTNKAFKIVIDKTCKILNNSDLLYIKPQAAWYIFINFANYKKKLKDININNSIELSQFLKEKLGIITLSGNYFGNTEFTLRLSLVDIDINFLYNQKEFTKNLEEGLSLLVDFLNNL